MVQSTCKCVQTHEFTKTNGSNYKKDSLETWLMVKNITFRLHALEEFLLGIKSFMLRLY